MLSRGTERWESRFQSPRSALEAALKDLGALARFEIVGAADRRASIVPDVLPRDPEPVEPGARNPMPALEVAPDPEIEPEDVEWHLGAGYFEPTPGSSEGSRAIMRSRQSCRGLSASRQARQGRQAGYAPESRAL